MFDFCIRYRLRLGKTLGNYSIPVHTLRVHQQFLDLKKLFNWLHNEHSSKRLDVRWFINKENFSLPLINMKRLRGKILSVLWQEIVRRTTEMRRCKFDSSDRKQVRDFLNDRGNCCRDFLKKQTKLARISE